jgi:hypothetical protein
MYAGIDFGRLNERVGVGSRVEHDQVVSLETKRLSLCHRCGMTLERMR